MTLVSRLFSLLGGKQRTRSHALSKKHGVRLSLEALEDRCTPTAGFSSIVSNFNGTAIQPGSTLWFASVFKASGLGSSPVTLSLTNQTITFSAGSTPYTVSVPDSTITFSPAATTATTVFDTGANAWQTTLPMQFSGNAFLSGVALPTPNGLPGGINPVTWQGQFASSTAGVSVNWQWAAAVYKSFSTDSTTLNVKPVDDNHVSVFQNSDHAGTPEAFTSFVTGGARGGGGSNYTGSYSATGSVTPPVQPPPPPPPVPQLVSTSLSGFFQGTTGGADRSGVLITLTGTTASGQVNMTTYTAADGSYSFTGLQAGTYALTETLPAAVASWVATSATGTVSGSLDGSSQGGSITNISLSAGDNGINYNFNDLNDAT